MLVDCGSQGTEGVEDGFVIDVIDTLEFATLILRVKMI